MNERLEHRGEVEASRKKSENISLRRASFFHFRSRLHRNRRPQVPAELTIRDFAKISDCQDDGIFCRRRDDVTHNP